MKYIDVLRLIRECYMLGDTEREDADNIFYEDVNALNSEGVIFPAVVAQLKTITQRELYDEIEIALTYADRREDKQHGIRTSAIYSEGNVAVRYIAETLRGTDGVDVARVIVTPFIYKFNEECAGVVAEITLNVYFDNKCFT